MPIFKLLKQPISVGIILASTQLALGYSLFHGDILFMGQGDIPLFLIPLLMGVAAFSINHSILIGIVNWLVLALIYFDVFRGLQKNKEMKLSLWLKLLILPPLVNISCIATYALVSS